MESPAISRCWWSLLSDARNLSLVREVLLAHAYWRMRGIPRGPDHPQPGRPQLRRAAAKARSCGRFEAHASDAGTDRPGGVFLRDWHAIPEEQRTLILASASIVLSGNRGSLQQQLVAGVEGLPLPRFVPAGGGPEEPSRPLPFLELPYFNGLGGFTPDGREYAIYLQPGATTPAPWVNVMANASFGAMVSESGLGFTWSGNSQSNRLTPWHNDPVSDPQSEIIYLRDDESGAVWTPTALPKREKDAYRARHGQGYTVFEHNSHAIGQELTVFVPVGEERQRRSRQSLPRCGCATIRRGSAASRLPGSPSGRSGPRAKINSSHIQTSRDEESGALLARQYWNGASRGDWAFAASSPKASSWSCDRGQFLGRDGSRSNPAALDRVRLDNRTGTGADPCAALQVAVTLERGQQTEVVFLLGQAETIEDVRAIVKRLQICRGRRKDASTRRADWWDSTLGALQVKTPILVRRFSVKPMASISISKLQILGTFCAVSIQRSLWLPRSVAGFDCVRLCGAADHPEAHPDGGGAAVPRRRRPALVASRNRRGRAHALLGRFAVAAIRRRAVHQGDERYAAFSTKRFPLSKGRCWPRASTSTCSSRRCPRRQHPFGSIAGGRIDHAGKLGPHELPLIGTGDWNDGMNLVGAEGRGESVWLGWFLCDGARILRAVDGQSRPAKDLADIAMAPASRSLEGCDRALRLGWRLVSAGLLR